MTLLYNIIDIIIIIIRVLYINNHQEYKTNNANNNGERSSLDAGGYILGKNL